MNSVNYVECVLKIMIYTGNVKIAYEKIMIETADPVIGIAAAAASRVRRCWHATRIHRARYALSPVRVRAEDHARNSDNDRVRLHECRSYLETCVVDQPLLDMMDFGFAGRPSAGRN